VSYVNPIATAQVHDSLAFSDLGLAVSLVGRGRAGEPACQVKLVEDGGQEREVEVAYGAIEVMQLALGRSAKLTIRPRPSFNIGQGPGRGTPLTVTGGAVGVIIDARGRPIASARARRRQALVQGWISKLGGRVNAIHSHYSHVTLLATLRRERLLPLAGDVTVQPRQRVEAADMVARTFVADRHHLVDVGRKLGLPDDKTDSTLVKHDGDAVKLGEPIAVRKTALGLRKLTARSPAEGRLVAAAGNRRWWPPSLSRLSCGPASPARWSRSCSRAGW
jgi:hypothetical protein